MKTSVNQRIVLLKNEMKLTDIDFCNRVEISTGTLQRIKKGEPISSKILTSISVGLNVNLDWINTGEGEKFLPEKSEKVNQLNPWKDALISELKGEVEFLRKLLLNVTGTQVGNFLNASDIASVLPKNSVRSVRAAA